MAVISGPGGNVSLFSGLNFKVAAWSATMQYDVVDTSGFSDAGVHTHDATCYMLVGSAIGSGTSGNAGPIPASATGASPAFSAVKGSITLTAASGCTLAFTGVVTSIPLNRVFNGKQDVMVSFVSDGAVTQMWA